MSGFCMFIAGACGLMAFLGIAIRETQASIACALTGILWLLFALVADARDRRKD